MTVLMVQHAFKMRTNLPEDNVVNTFHFGTPGPFDPADLTPLADLIEKFYDDAPTNGSHGITVTASAINNWMANGTIHATQRHHIKIYDLSDPMPRPPLLDRMSAYGAGAAPAGMPYPTEVSMCLSYKAAAIAGMPPSRLRGRIYLGPLSTNSGGLVADVMRPNTLTQASLVNAALQLAGTTDALGLTWGVYSRTNGGVTPDANLAPIISFWCDNAFDTIRSRGPAPTSRAVTVIP